MKRGSEKIYSNAGNEAVLELVPPNCTDILDIGCGAGDNAKRLIAAGKMVDGITFSEREAVLVRSVCRKVWVHNLEEGLPLDMIGGYDGIICSHVLEHICWPDRLLYDINKVLTPGGGLLIVALPNFIFIRQRLKILWGDFQYEPSGPWDETHFRWYTFTSGRRMLESHGFSVIYAGASGYFPLWVVRKWAPKWARIFDSIVCRIWPGLFGLQFLYVARPKEIFR